MSKFSQRETEKCITFPKLQQHSENTFTSCDGSVPFQCIINISVFTPGEGFLKMMCYHLAQLMDRVLPKEKKKKKITLQEQFLKKNIQTLQSGMSSESQLFLKFPLPQVFVCLFFNRPKQSTGTGSPEGLWGLPAWRSPKRHLDAVLGSLLWALLEPAGPGGLRGPFQPQPSWDSVPQWPL